MKSKFITVLAGFGLSGCFLLNDPPPCFQSSYQVELGEKISSRFDSYPECPEGMQEFTSFTVRPREGGTGDSAGQCSKSALEFAESPGGELVSRFTSAGGPGNDVGWVDSSVKSLVSGCDSRTNVSAHIPVDAVSFDDAVEKNQVTWTMFRNGINEGCGVPVPKYNACRDVFRSVMKKVK